MDFEGTNYRTIGDVKRLSFDLNFSVNNLVGSGAFGFNGKGYGSNAGTKQNLEFKFEMGKVIDPENRYVWSYLENTELHISGNVYDNNYDYFINDKPICYGGSKDPMIVEQFHINAENCVISADTHINSDPPKLSVLVGTSVDLKGTFNINVINDDPGLPFTIFSGTLKNKYLKIINLPAEVSYQPLNVIVQPQDGLVVGELEERVSFKTSVGDIEKEFTMTVVDN